MNIKMLKVSDDIQKSVWDITKICKDIVSYDAGYDEVICSLFPTL